MNYTVVGLFKDLEKAKSASEKLIDAGFMAGDVDVSPQGGDALEAHDHFEEDEETGGFWDWLFGEDEDTRTRYSTVGARNTVVTINTDSKTEAHRAVTVLDDLGAIDVNEEFDNVNMASASRNEFVGNDAIVDGEKTIPVVKEDIAVGKREVNTGGVSVRSTIIEKPVEENIRLRHERVYVKRNPVDRAVDAGNAFQDKTIEVTERNEEAVVEKTARVVEEVTVGKEVEQVNETITDTVRETDIEIVDKGHKDIDQGFEVVNFNDNGNIKGSTKKSGGFSQSRIDRSFSDVNRANAYYDFLLDRGFTKDDITVLMSKDTKEKFYAINDHAEDTGDSALKGAGTGSAIGGTVGAIAGAIATVGGAVLVPGLGLAIAGPIAAALAGAGVGGATGALVGALTNAGLSESLATEYDESLKRGEVIISVDPRNADDATHLGEYQNGRSLYNGYTTV